VKRRLLAAFALGLALSLIPVVAHACSCYLGDPRDALDEADGAFIGTYLAQRPVNPERVWGPAIYTFRVSEEIKGDFDETVEVRAQTQSSACGLGVGEGGEETGLLLYRTRSGAWTSSSCSQLSPEQMREAASELPPPTSEGPVRSIVGGSFHNEHSVSLDAAGEIVAYGGPGSEPESEAQELALCPGERRSVEVVHQYPDRARLIVRDLSSFEIERQFTLPFGRRPYRQQYVTAVVCRDEAATDVFVFASDHYFTGRPDATSYLQHVGRDGPDQITKGDALQASFTRSHAYLNGGHNGRKISRLELDTGERTFIARVPPRPGPLTLSPDGSMLAGVAEGRDNYEAPPSRAVLIELGASPRVISTSLHAKHVRGDMRWIDDDHVALLTPYIRRSRIYDSSLTLVERLGGWDAIEPSIDGNTVYGLRFDYEACFCSSVIAYDLDTEETTVVARPPTRVTNALVLLTP
jgi:hypothetical protein